MEPLTNGGDMNELNMGPGLPGSTYCPCRQLTRRVLEKWKGPQKVAIPQSAAIGGHAGGFTMLYDSHPAQDGLCWRCAKPEDYFKGGREREL